MFKRRVKPPVVPAAAAVSLPADEPMRLYIQHQRTAGYTTTRFYFTQELLPADNAVILQGLEGVVELFPDSSFRPGVRFYRHHVSVSWYPSHDEGDYELAFLESTMSALLSDIFVMKAIPTVLHYDESNPMTSTHYITDLELRLGVDWGPTSHQRETST